MDGEGVKALTYLYQTTPPCSIRTSLHQQPEFDNGLPRGRSPGDESSGTIHDRGCLSLPPEKTGSARGGGTALRKRIGPPPAALASLTARCHPRRLRERPPARLRRAVRRPALRRPGGLRVLGVVRRPPLDARGEGRPRTAGPPRRAPPSRRPGRQSPHTPPTRAPGPKGDSRALRARARSPPRPAASHALTRQGHRAVTPFAARTAERSPSPRAGQRVGHQPRHVQGQHLRTRHVSTL